MRSFDRRAETLIGPLRQLCRPLIEEGPDESVEVAFLIHADRSRDGDGARASASRLARSAVRA
jgi:hypothetical protein